jgi:hypothetical protein
MVMEETKPWYASKTVWGSVVAIASAGLMVVGVTISPDMMGPLAEALAALGTAAGSLFALYGRIVATKKIGS